MKVSKIVMKNGDIPFTRSFERQTQETKQRIVSRLELINKGSLGDHRSVGAGVIEFRIHSGPGLRIYAGRKGQEWILLLCCGQKDSQKRDIAVIQRLWQEWSAESPFNLGGSNDL